jgi:hypothetical protein
MTNWIEAWTEFMVTGNPPTLQVIPNKFENLSIFLRELSYIIRPEADEIPRA